jgi:hypothetical protein
MDARHFQARDGWIRRVPHGFSWAAFFLGPLWAFANRGWQLGLLSTLVAIPVEFLSDWGDAHGTMGQVAGSAVSLAFMFCSGRYGRECLAWSLGQQGYREVESASA